MNEEANQNHLVLPTEPPGPSDPVHDEEDDIEAEPLPVGVRPDFLRLLAERLILTNLPNRPRWLAAPGQESHIEQFQLTLRSIVLAVAVNQAEQQLGTDILRRILEDHIIYRNGQQTVEEVICSFLQVAGGGLSVGVFTRYSRPRLDVEASNVSARKQAIQALYAVMEALPNHRLARASHHHGTGPANAGFNENGVHRVWGWEYASILPIIHLLVIVSAAGFVTDLYSVYKATLQMAQNSVWAWVINNRQVYFVPNWVVRQYCINTAYFWTVPRNLRHPFVHLAEGSVARLHGRGTFGLIHPSRYHTFEQPVWTQPRIVEIDPGAEEMLGASYSIEESIRLLTDAETAPLPPGDSGPRLYRYI